MVKEVLKNEIITALEEIHDNEFNDIDIDHVLERDNMLDEVLNKYVEYFNYIDNKDAYNVNYCFKIALQDLNKFYDNQETELQKIINAPTLCTLDHNINEHIYEEVLDCQKKVKNLYNYTLGISFLTTFGLIFILTELAHLYNSHTFIEITILALIITVSKMLIDKMYIGKFVNNIAWKYFRKSIRRSLAFYFTSDIVLDYLSSNKISTITEEQLKDFKLHVRSSIDIILHKVL